VAKASPIQAEPLDKSASWQPRCLPLVVNLTLLLHVEVDVLWLDASLGAGAVTILSCGHGNCRITATAVARIWRVPFYNSQDSLILDRSEVTAMPEGTLAAREHPSRPCGSELLRRSGN
jgi:hydrogenase-1 operon protein HyaF